MIIGVPKEVKDRENRVAATPSAVHEYVSQGHKVLVQTSAGIGSGYTDDEYVNEGAELIEDASGVWGRAEMILKVKEPIAQEYDLMRHGQILFTYLHLAADEPLTRALIERNVQAIAYETVQLPNGQLPLLTPMSEVAGRMSIQVGAHFLERTRGGRGVLLGGIPGVPPAEVVVIGGGVVGTNAAKIALGMGANVTVIDLNVDRLRYLDDVLDGRINTLASSRKNIADAVKTADLVIGSVLIPGRRAPKLVTTDMVSTMKRGSVTVDVAIDQGGCFETSRPTTHSDPAFEVDGVVHYCVTNMPGALPRTGTQGLTNVTTPYGIALANKGWERALRDDPALALGANVINGHVTYAGVADAFNLPHVFLENAITGKPPA
ncbi:MAG TPA: alanine dehydrogenase [Thermomicrobiales bacterium]|nr:alanine dehydrogenase [Thermomicrobiales bacterium]